jgi:hypothetical protein
MGLYYGGVLPWSFPGIILGGNAVGWGLLGIYYFNRIRVSQEESEDDSSTQTDEFIREKESIDEQIPNLEEPADSFIEATELAFHVTTAVPA